LTNDQVKNNISCSPSVLSTSWEKTPLHTEPEPAIIVKGARVHNLRNITTVIPLNSLTVLTGVSGSGKSSLAFDTLYAEGQRRYIASLSAYARQFLERIDRPDVDDIEGICPALAIRQKNYSRNPRSTVGTVTEINDYLRLLFARIGVTYCHGCGRAVEQDTPESVADFIMTLPEGQRFFVCRRLVPESFSGDREPASRRSSRTASSDTLSPKDLEMALPGLQQQGFIRLLIGGNIVDLSQAVTTLKKNADKEVLIVVDRLVVQDDIRKRLLDSIELCFRDSGGQVEILLLSDNHDTTEQMLAKHHPDIRWLRHPAGTLLKFSEAFECQLCDLRYQTPEPRLFSFNNPFGACPECHGFGNTMTVDLNLVIPDTSKSLSAGAVHPWSKPRYRAFQTRLLQFAARENIPVELPWNELPESSREKIIHGYERFPGILGFFDYLETKKYKMHVRIFISRYRGYAPCLKCRGDRIRQEARDVLIGGKSIADVLKLTIDQASLFFERIMLLPRHVSIAERLLDEIRRRLDLLVRVGLNYISLDRLSSSLSGGESQRIQLAASLGSTLVGALYVLDEPSIGLHPRDSLKLVDILENLTSLGNTVLVVEHDPEIMRSADHIIDLGPNAGEHGGEVVFQGSYASLLENDNSLTASYLNGSLGIPVPLFRRKSKNRKLELIDAHKHNLKNLDVSIPLDLFVCISGVSGSGKSTLVHEVLYPAIKHAKGEPGESASGFRTIKGCHHLSNVILVDQSPIGKTSRSNPATYTRSFDDIRQIFAETRDAYSRGFSPGHFSFNLESGRCPTCQGNGTITIEMQFLADVELTCEDCKGTRFNKPVLEVRYKDKTIADVLDMTVRQALEFFAGKTGLIRKLRVLEEIGLGYLRLGQSATSLSGGEAQRIKLASYISRSSEHNTLYVFDEPTTGLHFDDIRKLLTAFDKLISSGNSLLVIEHNLEVIKTADWIIDMGPEGGDAGGRIVFEGTPEELATCERSYTGRFLRNVLPVAPATGDG
jgi:excinuclease ABC subunit A